MESEVEAIGLRSLVLQPFSSQTTEILPHPTSLSPFSCWPGEFGSLAHGLSRAQKCWVIRNYIRRTTLNFPHPLPRADLNLHKGYPRPSAARSVA